MNNPELSVQSYPIIEIFKEDSATNQPTLEGDSIPTKIEQSLEVMHLDDKAKLPSNSNRARSSKFSDFKPQIPSIINESKKQKYKSTF